MLTLFQNILKDRLSPFIGKTHCCVEQIDDEIKHVASLIKEAAEMLLPRFKDKTLSQQCAKSKAAWEACKDGGRPCEGPIYVAKCPTHKEVKKCIKICAAMEERKRVQRHEYLFKINVHSRFKLPQKKKSHKIMG